jgi:hypothetical protein
VTEVDSAAPSLIIDQLELPLEGVPPLSVEERVERWLGQQEYESATMFEAVLLLRDGRSRRERARRWFDLRTIQAPYDRSGWMIPGGEEAIWLYHEADRAYVSGLFLASLLCAHAPVSVPLPGVWSPSAINLIRTGCAGV